MSIISLINIRQGPSKSLRDYLTRFNESTTRVFAVNQEMSVGAFQNGPKVGYFNESLAQNSSLTLDEVVTGAECYIKGEESNVKNKACDAKEHVPGAESSNPQRKNNYTLHVNEKSMFKRAGKVAESFTSLNTCINS